MADWISSSIRILKRLAPSQHVGPSEHLDNLRLSPPRRFSLMLSKSTLRALVIGPLSTSLMIRPLQVWLHSLTGLACLRESTPHTTTTTGYAFNCSETGTTKSANDITTHIGIPASTANLKLSRIADATGTKANQTSISNLWLKNQQSVFASRVIGLSGSEALQNREDPVANVVRCFLPDSLRTASKLNELGIFFYVEVRQYCPCTTASQAYPC